MHSLSLIYYQISYEDKGGWYIVLGLIFLPSFMWQSTLPNKERISVQAAKLFTCSSKPDFSKQAIICWLSFIIMKPHKKKNKKKNIGKITTAIQLLFIVFPTSKVSSICLWWSAAIVAAAKASLLQRWCTQPVVLELWQPIHWKLVVFHTVYVLCHLHVSFSLLITVFSIYNYGLYISPFAGNISVTSLLLIFLGLKYCPG